MCSSVIEGVPRQLDAGQNGKNRTRVPSTTAKANEAITERFSWRDPVLVRLIQTH
jgi:hypothetical protein